METVIEITVISDDPRLLGEHVQTTNFLEFDVLSPQMVARAERVFLIHAERPGERFVLKNRRGRQGMWENIQ